MSQHIGCHNLLHGFNPPWSTQPCRIQRLFLPWGSTIGRVDSNRFEILWQAMLIIWLCWLGLFMLHYIFLWFSHDRRVFSDFDHPVTFSCCRCDWCTSSSYWCSTTSTCSVLGRGPQGSSGLKFSEEWPLIFVYPFGIIQPTRIKNNIQILFAISAISFISLSDKFHIFLSFGGRFFFALCVFGVFWNISTTVFAAGPLARERVWTSRCGSKSRLGLGFLGFMVRVFSWMIMIINRHPPGGFIYTII